MAKYIFILLGLFSFSFTFAQKGMSKKDSVSYSIGVVVAQNLKEQGFKNVNAGVMANAIYDVLNSDELEISKDLSDQVFRDELANLKSNLKKINMEAGEAFLAENKLKEGVTTLPSGLQYEVITEGTGPQPVATDKVKTHYHGMLTDGTVFDSSVQRGEPLSFELNRVIQAWQEALPLMKVGSKWRIFSPHQLAYGERQAGPLIKPYSTLIFEIELLGIE